MIYIEDYGIPIPKILKDMNYTIPKIALYKDNHIEIKQRYDEIVLDLNRVRNMGYKLNHSTALAYTSHYDLAYGHVILTGLGLNIVPNWLANKPEVTKITVIENDIRLIDYFKKYSEIHNKIELVYCDCTEYVGKCDVLLPDHWIQSSSDESKYVLWAEILNNIECDVFYIWRIPRIVKTYENYLKTRTKIPQLPYITEEKFISYND
jgi:hypothetical protein